jgi:hypothetical protein
LGSGRIEGVEPCVEGDHPRGIIGIRQWATLLHPWRAPRGEGWRIKRRRAEGRAAAASRRNVGLDEEETKQPNEEKRKATVQARLLRKGTMVIIKK